MRPLLLLLAAAAAPAAAELVHLSVVTRHGARERLTKDPRTFGEGGTQLTPEGQLQLYDVGVECAARYNVSAYSPGTVHVRSSDFDRTMASAQALLMGLYPAAADSLLPHSAQLVPVHTTPEEDDVLLRAYTKCGTFEDSVAAWYASAAFADEQAALADEIAEQAAAFADVYDADAVSLEAYWNFFDALNVLNDAFEAGSWDDAPDDWEERAAEYLGRVGEIADWAESRKFSEAVAGSLVGGLLARQLLENAQAAEPLALQLYSAHYPTLLGLLSALGLERAAIPAYGSLVALEVHDEAPAVRLQFQDGYDGAPQTLLELESVDDWAALVDSVAPGSAADWCRLCGNDEARDCVASFAVSGATQAALHEAVLEVFAAAFFVLVVVVVVWLYQSSSSGPGAGRVVFGGSS